MDESLDAQLVDLLRHERLEAARELRSNDHSEATLATAGATFAEVLETYLATQTPCLITLRSGHQRYGVIEALSHYVAGILSDEGITWIRTDAITAIAPDTTMRSVSDIGQLHLKTATMATVLQEHCEAAIAVHIRLDSGRVMAGDIVSANEDVVLLMSHDAAPTRTHIRTTDIEEVSRFQ